MVKNRSVKETRGNFHPIFLSKKEKRKKKVRMKVRGKCIPPQLMAPWKTIFQEFI